MDDNSILLLISLVSLIVWSFLSDVGEFEEEPVNCQPHSWDRVEQPGIDGAAYLQCNKCKTIAGTDGKL